MNTKRKLVLMLLTVFTMVFGVFGLTACGGSISLTSPSNISYDGALITWDAVEKATGYVIQINENGAEIKTESPSFPFKANDSEFSVKLKAIATGKKTVESEQVVMNFRPLPKVTDVTVSEEGVVSWSPVGDGSCSYVIRDNGVELPSYNTTCEISNFEVGTHKIEVRPVVVGDKSYYSSWTKAVTVIQLGKVDIEDIYYDGTFLTYEPVKNAESYNIYIDGILIEGGFVGKKYPFDANDTSFSVEIKTIGDHKTSFDGEISETKQFKFLPMVTGVKIEDGKLVWNEIPNADGYEVKINGSVKKVETNSYEGNAIVANKNLDISVRGTSKDAVFFSSFCEEISVYILPPPVLSWNETLSLDGGENSLIWNEVSGATGYEVSIKDPSGHVETETYGASQQNFANLYEQVGEYTITVIATANEGVDNIYSSAPSVPVTVVRPGPAERKGASEFIVSSATDLSNGFTVTCKEDSRVTFKLIKDGKDLKTNAKNQFKVSSSELTTEDATFGAEFEFAIKKMGKVDYYGNRWYVTLNSIDEDNLTFPIKILSAPQNVKMSGYNIEYEEVIGNNGYAITGVGSNPITENTLSRDLSSYLQAGNYNMQVCAKGNGKEVLPSNYSPILKVVRLDAPSDLIINTKVDGGKLLFTGDDFATGYDLYLNNDPADSNVMQIINMNSRISTAGTSVKLTSVANKYDEASGIYYMTSLASESKQFVKLKAPTNLTFTNTHLSWDLEGINDAAASGVTFNVYDAEYGTLFTESKSVKELDIGHLEGDRDYTFQVQAIGNGERYVDSEISLTKSIFKLATPEVEKDLANGVYTWQGVVSAVSYSVKVDGVVCDTAIHIGADNTYTFNPASYFDNEGDYSVVVTAVGNNGETCVSSKPYEIIQKAKQLTTPEFKVSYSHDQYNVEGNILVDIETESKFSKGYRYIVGDNTQTIIEGETTKYSINPKGPGKFNVEVFAVGTTFDNDGVYMLDSQSSGTQEIVILDFINKENINYVDTQIKWDYVSATQPKEFKVEIIVSGYETVVVTTRNKAIRVNSLNGISFDVLKTNKVTVKITAMGNGIDMISSQTTTKVWDNGFGR